MGNEIGLFAPGSFEPVAIGHWRRLAGPIRSRHTLELDALTEPAAGLLISARMMLTEIVQACGVAEVREVAGDGTIRLPHFGDRELAPWANEAGLGVSEDFLPEH